MSTITTTKELDGMRVVDAKKGRRIGKVRSFVFHPREKRCIGFLVRRPDAALMFHRKDLFVSLGGFHIADGQVVVHDDTSATDKGAIRALGVDWDACVLWVGMPVMTKSGSQLGYVRDVSFDRETGEVESLSTEDGATSDLILGRRVVPARFIRGFRKGQGVPLVQAGAYEGEEIADDAELGAVLVSDEALDLSAEGGAAAAAGKATAVVAHKARKGAARAKAVASEKTGKAKPAARAVAKKTGEAVEAGSFAVGKQLGRASGMFAAFKEEFDKAAKGEED